MVDPRPGRGDVARDACWAGAGGTGYWPTPPPCSARRRRAWREAARGYVARGFRAVKFGWGVFGEDPGRDRELVAAAREALGPDRTLLVDPGWYPAGWNGPGPLRSRREALALCEWLADYGVGWVEDFIHPERFEEYAAVRAAQPRAGRRRRAGCDGMGFRSASSARAASTWCSRTSRAAAG